MRRACACWETDDAGGSRYDGHADWCDEWNGPHAERNADAVADLLGPGHGLCLDLGCGGGLYFGVLASTGRTVVGLDRSAGQLRLARADPGMSCTATRRPCRSRTARSPRWPRCDLDRCR